MDTLYFLFSIFPPAWCLKNQIHSVICLTDWMGKIKKRYFFDGTEYLAKVHVVSEKIHKKMGKVLFHKKKTQGKRAQIAWFWKRNVKKICSLEEIGRVKVLRKKICQGSIQRAC